MTSKDSAQPWVWLHTSVVRTWGEAIAFADQPGVSNNDNLPLGQITYEFPPVHIFMGTAKNSLEYAFIWASTKRLWEQLKHKVPFTVVQWREFLAGVEFKRLHERGEPYSLCQFWKCGLGRIFHEEYDLEAFSPPRLQDGQVLAPEHLAEERLRAWIAWDLTITGVEYQMRMVDEAAIMGFSEDDKASHRAIRESLFKVCCVSFPLHPELTVGQKTTLFYVERQAWESPDPVVVADWYHRLRTVIAPWPYQTMTVGQSLASLSVVREHHILFYYLSVVWSRCKQIPVCLFIRPELGPKDTHIVNMGYQ